MSDPKLSNCRCGKHAVFQQGGSGGWYARCHYARCWYGPERDTKEDAAEAWNAALRADAAGWVSFDDPPKTDGQYHVYRFATNGTYKGRPFQWIAMWENGTWLDYDPMADDYIHECEPTHWRPLPPAPEVKP